jgi:hypothetical protein
VKEEKRTGILIADKFARREEAKDGEASDVNSDDKSCQSDEYIQPN